MDSSRALSIPRASNGAPINSSELRFVNDKRPAYGGRDWEELESVLARTGDGSALFWSRDDDDEP